jgi:hypothetical protein
MNTHGKSCNCRFIWVSGSILKIIVDGRTYDLRVAVIVKTLAILGKWEVLCRDVRNRGWRGREFEGSIIAGEIGYEIVWWDATVWWNGTMP